MNSAAFVRRRRRAIERIEILGFILRHKTIDKQDIETLRVDIAMIKRGLARWRYAQVNYDIQLPEQYDWAKEEYKRLVNVLKWREAHE